MVVHFHVLHVQSIQPKQQRDGSVERVAAAPGVDEDV